MKMADKILEQSIEYVVNLFFSALFAIGLTYYILLIFNFVLVIYNLVNC